MRRWVPAAGARARMILVLTGHSLWRGLVGIANSDDLTHAASIAYYALLSLFPFLLLVLSVIGSITTDEASRVKMLDFVLRYFPTRFEFLTTQLDLFRQTRLRIGVAGGLALIWASLGVFGAVTSAVNHAWGVEKQRSFLRHRMVSFLMLLAAGATLLLTVILFSAGEVVQTTWFAQVVERFPGLHTLAGFGVRVRGDAHAHHRHRPRLLLHSQRQGQVSRCLGGSDHHRAALARGLRRLRVVGA